MAQLAVTGYASLDYAVVLGGTVQADRTTHIRFRDTEAWPRAGGSPTYVAGAAAGAGVSAAPITWVGDDALGAAYIDHCRAAGLDVSGIAQHAAARSPASIMVHQADGSTACLYDPGFEGAERLSDAQIALIRDCNMLCVTVGPGHLIDDILRHRPDGKPLCWVMKDDQTCFGPANRAALAKRSGLIFCNTAEKRLLAETDLSHAIIVETRGAQGVRLHHDGEHTELATTPVAVSDPTGAGDSFAGAFIAASLGGAEPVVAAGMAMESVRVMLQDRSDREAKQQ